MCIELACICAALQLIDGINYDIITPKCMEDFRHGTWYDVKPGEGCCLYAACMAQAQIML